MTSDVYETYIRDFRAPKRSSKHSLIYGVLIQFLVFRICRATILSIDFCPQKKNIYIYIYVYLIIDGMASGVQQCMNKQQNNQITPPYDVVLVKAQMWRLRHKDTSAKYNLKWELKTKHRM